MPRKAGLAVALAAVVIGIGPGSAAADHDWRRGRRTEVERPSDLGRYLAFKGGGMLLAAASSGGYFGFEAGRSAGWLEAGISLDWFHRRSRETEIAFETGRGFDPPLRGEITRFESRTDFVPLGVTLRVRIPTAAAAVTPFVSGSMAYEILHLSFHDRDRVPQPYDELLGDSQTLFGLGWQVAAGVLWQAGAGAGFFGEAGWHSSEPHRRLHDAGVPVDVRADLDGAFLRAGVRLSL